jgi:signal transduction histidine kinase
MMPEHSDPGAASATDLEAMHTAQKLEAVGRLAAGIAHEINTPIQFVGDNTRFLQDAFDELSTVLASYRMLRDAAASGAVDPALLAQLAAVEERADLAYLEREVPRALAQSLEGVERVASIVRAMKDFSHPGSLETVATDLNRAIESTIVVARNEWKYVANVVTDWDRDLPLVPCLVSELTQVILNMILNAVHAIADVVGDGGGGKGTITIGTRRAGEWVEVRISDTGTGIRDDVRQRIFDPFFTTKDVGKGTGQGLAIARAVVVEKHHGTITVESEWGRGTTFVIRLPLGAPESALLEATP